MSVYAQVAQETSSTQRAAIKNAAKISTSPQDIIPGREADQAANNGGGVSFVLDDWGVFARFLMIGTESAGYYVGSKEQTKQGFTVLKKVLAEDAKRAIDMIVEISTSGRAPKNDPAIVALAVAAANPASSALAWDALSKVCRIGTHLFQFIELYDTMGKWNAAAKRGVANWYQGRKEQSLAVQMLKYKQRNGWAQRDVLRLAHVKPRNEVESAIFRHAVKGEFDAKLPELYHVVQKLNAGVEKKEAISLIEQTQGLSWEMIPTQYMKDLDVLMALLPNMGMTALIRKLGAFTSAGLFDSVEARKLAVAKLNDTEALKKGRVHPLTVLQAYRQYEQGRGDKGSLVWTPEQAIKVALDDAFYAAFDQVESTGENYLVGVDISGSMRGATVNGSSNLSADLVAVVMAMAAVRTQKNATIVGFNHKIVDIGVKPTMSLDTALKTYLNMRWDGGGTDCAKAYEHALNSKLDVDKFVIITDNETNSGTQHPAQALAKYRQKSGRVAKSAIIATSVSKFTIADPKDRFMLDIAGFDSAAPNLIADL